MLDKKKIYDMDAMYNMELMLEEYLNETENPCFNGYILYVKNKYKLNNEILSYLLEAYIFSYKKILSYIEEGIDGKELIDILKSEYSEELKKYINKNAIIKNRISNVKKVHLYASIVSENTEKKENQRVLKK